MANQFSPKQVVKFGVLAAILVSLPWSGFAGELQFEVRDAGRRKVELSQLEWLLQPGDEGYQGEGDNTRLPLSSSSSARTICQMAGYRGAVENVSSSSSFDASGSFIGVNVFSDQSVELESMRCVSRCEQFQNKIDAIVCLE